MGRVIKARGSTQILLLIKQEHL